MQKGGRFDIVECPQRIFHFSRKKWTCTSKRGRMVALVNNAIHMRPEQGRIQPVWLGVRFQ